MADATNAEKKKQARLVGILLVSVGIVVLIICLYLITAGRANVGLALIPVALLNLGLGVKMIRTAQPAPDE